MNVINIDLESNEALWLGHQGENEALEIQVDYSNWVKLYGEGTIALVNIRNAETDGYLVGLDVDNHIAKWLVSSADTEKAGVGQAEFRYTVGDVLAKSKVFKTYVVKSITDGAEPPSVWQSYIDQINELVYNAQITADEAIGALTKYPAVIDGNWHIYDIIAHDYIDTGVKAQGERGYSPSAKVERITDGAIITITDEGGTTTAEVHDGEGDVTKEYVDEQTESVRDYVDEQTSALSGGILQLDTNKADKTVVEALSESVDAKASKTELTEGLSTKADQSNLDDTNRSLDLLWKLNKGQTYDFETVEKDSYSNAIPSGAKLGSIQQIGGKSVVMNQLCRIKSFNNQASYGVIVNGSSDTGISISGTATSGGNITIREVSVVESHKYLIYGVADEHCVTESQTYSTTKGNRIFIARNTGIVVASFYLPSGSNYTGKKSFPMCFDLTQMFGAGNEPSIEECKQIFTEDYYPYNEGELVSASSKSVEIINAQGEVTHEITTDYGILRSAGSVYDYIDFERSVIVRRVGVASIKDLVEKHPGGWYKSSTYPGGYYYSDWVKNNSVAYSSNHIQTSFITAKHTSNYAVGTLLFDNSLNIRVDNSLYPTFDAFRQHMINLDTIMFYELAAPTEEPITITDNVTALEVEANGSITFKNDTEYNIPVHNKTEYLIKLDEA